MKKLRNQPLTGNGRLYLAGLFAGFSLLTLAACGGGGNTSPTFSDADAGGGAGTPNSGGGDTGEPETRCSSPLPREVQQHIVTSPVPNALDTQRVTVIQDTTDFHVSVFLPERCPGDTFPVVIESHGYSGARETELTADGTTDSSEEHFPSLDTLFRGLPFHGYVAVSFDERGHGDSTPNNVNNPGGYARGIDPEAETQDAIALLDWLYDNRADFFIEEQTGTGVAKDFPVGLIGGSYGGAYQMVLAALDERIDTIVPNGTWHNLLYSLLPGDSVKLGFAGLLCLLADQGGVVNSPVFAETCNAVSYDNPQATNQRTRQDLADDLANRQAVTEAEVVELFGTHGMNFLQKQQAANQPALSSGSAAFTLRSVPSLFLQGNRDILFNITEAYWNWSYFRDAADSGVPVKLLTTEGTHMNPLANMVEAGANCGNQLGVDIIRAWFDFHLKGVDSAAYNDIPDVCISVTDTASAHSATKIGLKIPDMPIGSQTGTGGMAARLNTGTASVVDLNTGPTFVSIATITGDNNVLAGIPTIESMTVADDDDASFGVPADVTAIALVGVGIQRGGSVFLVDDQVTAFLEGEHSNNRNIGNDIIMLAGVGEQLQDGDEVGLLFYESHLQYSAIISPSSATGVTGLVGFLGGIELPPIASALGPLTSNLGHANPYTVTLTGVELPILNVSTFPGASLLQ